MKFFYRCCYLLKKTFDDNIKKFSDIEKKLKKEEKDLLAKKTVITQEEYGKFSDAMLGSDWWNGTIEWSGENYPDLRNLGTTIYYDSIS